MPTNDDEFFKMLREAFAVEAAEHLQAMTQVLLALEAAPPAAQQKDLTETIFREAHSLKGAARSVNRDDVESICQVLESLFDGWKKQGAPAQAEIFDALSAAIDFLGRSLNLPEPDAPGAAAMVRRLRQLEGRAPPPAPTSEPAKREEHLYAAEPAVVTETIRIAASKLDAHLLEVEEMIAVKNAAEEQAGELRAIGSMMESWNKEWSKAAAELQRARTALERTSATRLFDFLEWNHSYLRSIEERLAVLTRHADADRRAMSNVVDKLLNGAKRLVMLPFATVLDAFPKQVRDLARDEGKQVELTLRGREIEIDKRILEQMKDPLVHLIRNAVDHGLEHPAERRPKQKPERGSLSVAVSQVDAGKVEIIVADDGAGIDLPAVRAAAAKAGIAPAADGERAALGLIFHSGLSTSAIITEISGRGLGMAIVREKVEKLGGQIEVESQPDRGTRFRIVLPVTLATFKGLLIRAGGQDFILPIHNVERVTRVALGDVRSVENREMISWENRALALVRLAAVLGLPARERPEDLKYLQTVILSAGETRLAFVVEEVWHEQEVLVKPLQKPLVSVRNIAAATVLGSGRAVLILNVPALLQNAAHFGAGTARPAPYSEKKKARTILVTDDSMTSRMLIKNILTAAGYEVKTAIDGLEALHALKTQPVDLVVSDVEMPRLNGFDLTEKIRADKRLAHTPVVLVTALETPEHRERGVDVGADAYIVKSSFDQSNLLEIVGRLI